MQRLIALSITGLIAACSATEMPDAPEGAQLFADNCAACHGTSATGDGVLVSELTQKPADLTRISARNGGTFPRAQVLSVIDGYSKGTHPGRVMPEFGLLLEGDTVPVEVDGVLTPTPRPLAALLAYLEDIQQ
jgi:mono/diheme cytochrome c family protein